MTRSEASTSPATDDLKAIFFFDNTFNIVQRRAILLPFQSRENVSIEDITAFEKFKTQYML